MKLNNIYKFFPIFVFALSSFSTFAQQRVVEESLVYDDPTVARPGKWIFGLSVDYLNTSANSETKDSTGDANGYQKSNSSQVGGSAVLGYGDLSLLINYAPSKTTINNNSGVKTAETAWLGEVNLRWLIMDLKTKYFVPYVLGGYVRYMSSGTSTGTWTGWQKGTIEGPGLGVGGIVPLTEKYGFRADIKQYYANSTTTNSNVSYNTTDKQQFWMITATAYYNITQNINFQLGAQNNFIQGIPYSSQTGFYGKLGYTFH